MKNAELSKTTQILVVFTYVGMIAANVLANALPINGLNTGEVSDSYPNLFAPAGMTFAVWGVIYLMLAAYTLYQAGGFRYKGEIRKEALLNKIGILFSISSLANTAWIFAWHYKIIFLSLVLIITVLLSLILINKEIIKEKLSSKERFFIRLPFSLYFGWLTVATIANATTFLVHIQWTGFGLSEVSWTVFVLFAGLGIGLSAMLRNRDIAYGLVLIWAYFGILTKHVSPNGFDGRYGIIIAILYLCLVIFIAADVFLIYTEKVRVEK